MMQTYDILSLAHNGQFMEHELQLFYEKEQQIPGSVQYSIKRYKRNIQWNTDDIGMVVYNVQHDSAPGREEHLDLHFCITGNSYCSADAMTCSKCTEKANEHCRNKVESLDVISFRFSPQHLSQFVKPKKAEISFSNEVLAFRHPQSFSKMITLCGRTRSILESLLNHNYTGAMENIFINAQSQMLLLYSMECVVGEKESETFRCKFLANEMDREKIIKARDILLQNIGNPITIKELSRKVAINECYLKKGFKELFGTTIFEYYQNQRMEHARYLLYDKGLSVTEVSMLLGYSSISHFSTAFKKHTGLKPCELLLRAN